MSWLFFISGWAVGLFVSWCGWVILSAYERANQHREKEKLLALISESSRISVVGDSNGLSATAPETEISSEKYRHLGYFFRHGSTEVATAIVGAMNKGFVTEAEFFKIVSMPSGMN